MHSLVSICYGRSEPSSSVCILTAYGLGNWCLIPNRCRGFFLYPLCLAGCGAHPASYAMGAGSCFLWYKVQVWHDADHSLPSSAKIKKERGFTSSHPKNLSWHAAGQLYCLHYRRQSFSVEFGAVTCLPFGMIINTYL
jgi:hypothetical protein